MRIFQKYGAKRTEFAGQGFRSKLEALVYQTLLLMEKAGEITNIRREQPIQLTPSIKHKLDFVVTSSDGQDYGIEAKGAVDASWSIKRRLYQDFGPFMVQVWRRGSGDRVGVDEEIPAGKYRIERKA